MTASWIVTAIVIAFLIFFLIWGFHRGFLRIVLTTMAFVVTVAASAALTPWFSGVIDNSFIGRSVHERIDTYIDKNLNDPVINSVDAAQEAVIDKLPLPKFLRTDISDKNNVSEYVRLQVDSFTEYLNKRLSGLVIGIIAYIILMILIYLILRILLGISKVISKIPVVGGVNRFLGGLVGVLEGLLILWCICLVIMIFAGTPFGARAMEVINGNAFLKFIYDKNGILLGLNALLQTIM